LTRIDRGGRRRIYGLLVILAGCLLFAVRGYQNQKATLQAFDFKPVYSSARCLIDGCDPYDSMQIEHEFLQHGGDRTDLRPFRPFNANYPPSALFLVIPLAMLPFGVACAIWSWIGIVLFCGAALCVADLCEGERALMVQCVLAVFVAASTMLIMLGQPAMMSISLAVIAVWCFLRGRLAWLGVLAFAVSLTFKPHVGALVWLFFLLASRGDAKGDAARMFRRRALETLGVTLILMAPGMLLAFHHAASAHWPRELHTNLVGIGARGNASDPGPTNGEAQAIVSLQAVFSLVRDVPRFYDLAAYAVFVPLFGLWLHGVVRPVRGWTSAAVDARNLLALAAAAALGFLPIYHRQYDTRLLLLMFPAVAVLAASGSKWMGRAAIALSVVVTVTTSHQFVHAGPWLAVHGFPLTGPLWLLVFRPLPLTLLLVSCFFLYALLRVGAGEPEA
jgi:Glycosyltransferase family 87